jgi:hypothetical protein
MAHLEFVLCKINGKKTYDVEVNSVHEGSRLGIIKWYSNWRCYVLYPDWQTIWSDDCLQELKDYITMLNREHRDNLRREKENVQVK